MKLCAVSPFETASKDDILRFLEHADAELVVLPGFCRKNTPTPIEIRDVIQPGTAIFVEKGKARFNTRWKGKTKGKVNAKSKAKPIPYLVTSDHVVPMPIQIFAHSSTASAENIKSLKSAWNKRTFDIGSRKVTFVICGEINGFDRHGRMKHQLVVPQTDILANPTHTVMGHWNVLGPKLSALSRGRVVVHVANNNRNHDNLSTDIRIYVNGELQHDQAQSKGKLKWCECEI